MRPYRSVSRRVLSGALLVGSFSVTTAASADVTSWYSVAGGASYVDQGRSLATPLVDFDLGVGTKPLAPVVFGGLFHLGAQFDVGADLGGALRVCSGGYARGEWGLGLDLGSYYRVATYGGAAGFGRVVLGGPWGLVLHLGGAYGEGSVTTLSASLGIDFARLTVHRNRGTETLPSPLSSPDPKEMAGAPALFSF